MNLRIRPKRAGAPIAVVALSILAGADAAKAQTAEETVLFIWTGLDAKPDDRTITKLGNCKYVITHRTADRETIVDFGNVTVFQVATFTDHPQPRVTVHGIDLHARVTDLKTGTTKEFAKKEHWWRTSAPVERMEKAISYFRGSFCKGRAF